MTYESNNERKPRCEHCGAGEFSHELSADGQEFVCDPDNIRRFAANAKRKARAKVRRAGIADAMKSIGMVKVRGNLGGTYWE